MSNDAEQWKEIGGYEGFYEVSNRGRVLSIARHILCKNGAVKAIKSRFLKASPGSHGYLTVCLSREGKYDYRTVHTLVAVAFVPNPHGRRYVEHKDRNPINNRSINLRWTTQQLNTLNTDQSPRGSNNAIGVYEHTDGRERKFAVRFAGQHRGSFLTLQSASDFRNSLYNEALKTAI